MCIQNLIVQYLTDTLNPSPPCPRILCMLKLTIMRPSPRNMGKSNHQEWRQAPRIGSQAVHAKQCSHPFTEWSSSHCQSSRARVRVIDLLKVQWRLEGLSSLIQGLRESLSMLIHLQHLQCRATRILGCNNKGSSILPNFDLRE